jgi:hypothetical protein
LGEYEAALTPAIASFMSATIIILWGLELIPKYIVITVLISAAVFASKAIQSAGSNLSSEAYRLRLLIENRGENSNIRTINNYAMLMQVEAVAKQLASTWPLAIATLGLAGLPISIIAYHLAYIIHRVETDMHNVKRKLVSPMTYSVLTIATYGVFPIILYPIIKRRR